MIKVASVRFQQEVKCVIYGERRGLANQPKPGEKPQFDVEMTYDPETCLLTIRPTRPGCDLPPVLIPREGILWMEPLVEPPVKQVKPEEQVKPVETPEVQEPVQEQEEPEPVTPEQPVATYTTRDNKTPRK
jgi:hypothetical protein